MDEITIRGEGSEYLTISVLGRSNPDSADCWDGNWLRAAAEVSVSGFCGAVSGELRADELAAFAGQLAQLQESLQGEARFETMEHWLTIRASGDGRGHMECRCAGRDRPGIGNKLECVLHSDQTLSSQPSWNWPPSCGRSRLWAAREPVLGHTLFHS